MGALNNLRILNTLLKAFVEKKKNDNLAYLANDIRCYKLTVFNVGKKLGIISKTLETYLSVFFI